jgi:hypothetical protein
MISPPFAKNQVPHVKFYDCIVPTVQIDLRKGEQFSPATVDFCPWAKLKPPEHLSRLRCWHAAVSERPSAKA